MKVLSGSMDLEKGYWLEIGEVMIGFFEGLGS